MRIIKTKIRKQFGPFLQLLAYRIGVMQFMAQLQHKSGAIVLMYHSVANDSHAQWIDPRNHVPHPIFDKQMNFLARRKKVISLAELITQLRKGKTPDNETIVLTFDDGYLDNLTIAAPILEHYGLTATIFLPTGYIDRGETQWVDQAYAAFKFRKNSDLIWGEKPPTRYNLDEPIHYDACYQAVCRSLLISSPAKRRILLDDLRNQLLPFTKPPRLTMTWDDVFILMNRYKCFEIGTHSQEHTSMTTLSEHDASCELLGCLKRIKAVMGKAPRFFSFPYGRTSMHLRQLVAETGYEASCGGAGEGPIVDKLTDPFALPRIAAPVGMRRFELATSVANTRMWRRLGR